MKESRQFERGLAHFNAREFFEAHEVWEELWLAAPDPEKIFLQGMIQIAAAFHHYSRQNLRGTKSLLVAGLAKIDGFPGDHRGLALAELRVESYEWAAALAAEKDLGRRKPPKIRTVGATAARKIKRGG
jgi:predicted metal-dependent hydrolase